MGFSEQKKNLLTQKNEKALSTFFIALFLSATFFVPYMITDNGYFLFFGDFNVQQIPFYQYCHQAVREGNIFWSFNTDLGANFIGSYSFYLLGSPFFWLTLPFPNSFVPYLMAPLLMLKFSCSAVTAYLYIRRFTRTPEAARLGGILYAFSGFSVYNVFFNHFHEAIVVFPLLLLSLEMLITENKRFVFALTVCLCAVVNYFFFFGMVVFCMIYYFVRVLSKAVKFKVSNFLILCFEAVLGVLLSAFILLPSVLAILGNGRVSNFLLGWDGIMYGKEQIYANILQCFFFPPDLPARPIFFPDANVKWSSLGGWLPLFSTVGVFTFFAKRKNHWLKRIIGICVFMALVPILNSAFYAFNSSYYARWFYMPVLMMCLATVILTEDRSVDWNYGYKWVFAITVAVFLVIGFFPQKDKNGEIIFGLYSQGTSEEDLRMYAGRFFLSCLIAIVSLVILGLILKAINENLKMFYKAALACVCIITIIYANVFILTGRSHSYEIEDVMIEDLVEGKVDLGDETQFRIDTYGCVDNTALYLGLPSINAFHSVVPSSIMDFYDYIGIKRDVASRPETDYYALRPLLSVKYLLNRTNGNAFFDSDTEKPKMAGFKYLETQNDYYIYENENYIPYGFSYECYMDYDFCDRYNKKQRANLMLKAILLTDEQIEKYGYMFEDIKSSNQAVICDENALEYDSEKLAKTSAIDFEINKYGFTAKVERQKDSLVFFSVPYDEGFSATVNGKKAEIERVNVGFMAVKVEKGISEIKFTYKTPGLLIGTKITVITAVVLLVYVVSFLIYRKHHNRKPCYPEGDLLLKIWKKQENEEMLEEAKNERRSLLDKIDDLPNLGENKGFYGGFKINTDINRDK